VNLSEHALPYRGTGGGGGRGSDRPLHLLRDFGGVQVLGQRDALAQGLTMFPVFSSN
jgi:hypothetical protein